MTTKKAAKKLCAMCCTPMEHTVVGGGTAAVGSQWRHEIWRCPKCDVIWTNAFGYEPEDAKGAGA